MLWTALLVLLLMWALGVGFGIAGNLIHLLLVVAVVVLIVNVLQGRRVICADGAIALIASTFSDAPVRKRPSRLSARREDFWRFFS